MANKHAGRRSATREVQIKTATTLTILSDASNAGQGIEKRDYPATVEGRTKMIQPL